jgi:hypothetical protein
MRLERGGFHDGSWPMVIVLGEIEAPWSSARCRLVALLTVANSSHIRT